MTALPRTLELPDMVIVSCSGKFHAFALAEQLQRHGILGGLYTTYAFQKNKIMRRFTSRVDRELIPPRKIQTNIPIAIKMKRGAQPFDTNEMFDKWVARKIARKNDYNVFIGWSGMSLHAMKKAKAAGKTVIVERGSSHIQYQDEILKEEYKKFGIDFKIDPRTIAKELQEYQLADYISIPSGFVKNSFLKMGVPENKLVQNPYGSSSHFRKATSPGKVSGQKKNDGRFRILYLGSLLIRKGLIYHFEALRKLNIPPGKVEAWFIGKVDGEMKQTVEKYKMNNWKFFGHINHYDLPQYISACDVAVQPSLEEGLSMVIPQMLGCGTPVIATTNSGGGDVIENGSNGFIVPIRDPDAIAAKIEKLYNDRPLLENMKSAAADTTRRDFSWNGYGDRYVNFINKINEMGTVA